MPKIMYRPNPVPPPFVPPTPPAPVPSVSINPYPFEADEEIIATFENVIVPESANLVEFFGFNVQKGEENAIAQVPVTAGSPLSRIEGACETQSSLNDYYMLRFIDDSSSQWIIIQEVTLTHEN